MTNELSKGQKGEILSAPNHARIRPAMVPKEAINITYTTMWYNMLYIDQVQELPKIIKKI
jgi:hypothetical protein